MEKEILISVIVPVYNLEKYIVPCIHSIVSNRNVTLEQFEILVVNDGSTDSSRENVERYIVEHPDFNIRLFNQENQGVSAARNTGLENAAGRFVWFVDGDDAIVNFALHTLLEVILTYDVHCIRIGECLGGLKEDNSVIDLFENHTDKKKFQLQETWRLLEWPYKLGHINFIWKRNFLIENGLRYPVGISQNEDYCFIVSGLLKADMVYINRSYDLYVFRTLKYSASRGKYDYLRRDKYIKNKFLVLDRLLSLKEKWENEEKENLYRYYMNYYIHTIVSNCYTLKCPLSLILYSCYRLKAMKLYPIKGSLPQVSIWRKWLCNHIGVFVLACWVHRVIVCCKRF